MKEVFSVPHPKPPPHTSLTGNRLEIRTLMPYTPITHVGLIWNSDFRFIFSMQTKPVENVCGYCLKSCLFVDICL